MTTESTGQEADYAPDYANRLAQAALPSVLCAAIAAFIAFAIVSIFGHSTETTLHWMIIVAILGGGGCYIGMFFTVRSPN